jgi:V8-like Glu-specific endopeptidase
MPEHQSLSHMTLDELANAAPIRATQKEPASIQEILKRDSGVYIQAEKQPALDFAAEEVQGSPGIWQLRQRGSESLTTVIPGGRRTELQPPHAALSGAIDGTDGYRPPWVDMEFMPRLVPFRSPVGPNLESHVFLEPRAQEADNLSYPWRTNGLVFANGVPVGSGTLVGPNLMLTASHIAPWDSSPWSMEFVPGFRSGTRPPFGSSFVSEFRGYRVPAGEATGYDYIVCRLFRPLGQAIGWMGSVSFGNEDDYYRRRYNSTGYPDSFGNRPAVQFDMAIADIDNDSPGLELEFPLGIPLGPGWSGGALWLPNEGPRVAGTVTGVETDVLDPRRHVISAGSAMVDLVKFGLDNWRP